MKISKAIIFIVISLAALSGCNAGSGDDTGNAQLINRYYCQDALTLAQAWKLNIEDGSILTGCPDPLCGHGNKDKECPFRSKSVDSVADAGKLLFYIADGPSGIAIYCFNTEENSTSVIYEYDKFPSSNWTFVYGDGRLYFDIPRLKTTGGTFVEMPERTLMYYDLATKKIEKFGEKDEHDWVLFAYTGKVYYRPKNEAKLCVSSGSFDGSDAVPLPEGGRYDVWNGYYACGPGYVANSGAPDIFLYDEKRSVPLPSEVEGSYFVGLTATEDTFYCALGKNQTTDTEGEKYTVKILVLSKNGEYSIYAVHSNFSFYPLKGFGNRVVCSVLYEYVGGEHLVPGTEEDNTEKSLLLIDLDTGKTSMYNEWVESMNVHDLYLGEVTLKVEKLK